MISARRRVAVALGTLAVLAAAWPIAAGAAATDQPDERAAVNLVRKSDRAAERYEYRGTAGVTWTASGGLHHTQVLVSDESGAIEIVAPDGGTVIDAGGRAYLRNAFGWTGVVAEPALRSIPDPAHHWTLATGPPRRVAGRAATVVVASRADGSPALRLSVDDQTGLVLAREVLDPRGRVERSVRFVRIDIGPSATVAVTAPPGVRNQSAVAISSIPDGYHTPRMPDGYELVARSRHDNGVMFFYSDGLFSASVFEQRGELDRSALAADGSDLQKGRTAVHVSPEPSGDAAVWDRDGIVYTAVTDAPHDAFSTMLDSLAADDRSAPQSIVDFVLGPFSWG